MAVTFLLGRAGSGKTRFCLDAALAELAREERASPVILLVPEQASFQMERALALGSVRGGFWRAEVLSFSRLARRLRGVLGDGRALLPTAGRRVALRALVAGLPTPLAAYREPSYGFYAHLDAVIESLLSENVDPDELAAAAARIRDPLARSRVEDVHRVYAAYRAWLGSSRIDAAGQLAILREQLDRATWLHGARIWVDGFAGFTGQELATLAGLGRVAAELWITLLVEPEALLARTATARMDATDLFTRTRETHARLRAAFAAAGVPCGPDVRLAPAPPPRFRSAADLARIEAAFASPPGAADRRSIAAPSGEVQIVTCDTHREELRAAARDILGRMAAADGRLRFRDFAVITRDIEPLAETIVEVFDEFAIPFFLDRRRPLRAHPLHRLVEALFDVALRDWPAESLARMLRTGLLPLSRIDADLLDELIAAHHVAGAAVWQAADWPFAAGDGRDDTPTLTPRLAAARRTIADALRPLAALARSPTPAAGATWAATLLDALAALEIRSAIERWIAEARAAQRWEAAELHRLAWEGLCETLETVHTVLSTTPLDAADAAGVICGALADRTLGLAPPKLDQVLISSIERSRHPEIRHAWLVAFNEGIFPRPPADDRLLSAADRRRLVDAGLSALTPAREDAFGERLLAYIALTRPSQSLTISYARKDAAGEPLLPSPLLAEVLDALPGLAPRRPDPCPPPAGLADAARGYLDALAAGDARTTARFARLRRELESTPAHAARFVELLAGLRYQNDPQPLDLPGDDQPETVIWRGGPSELETFLQCPFKHFADHRLRIRPEVGVKPIRWELGEIAHALLAAVTQQAIDSRVAPAELNDARWQAWLADAWQVFERSQPADLPERRPDLLFASGRLRQFVSDLVTVHAERWRRSGFRPVQCEVRFGRAEPDGGARTAGDRQRGPLRLRSPAGQLVELVGQIDRIDAWTDPSGRTWQLVYDYKSSPTPLRTPVLTGAALQVFAYLLALHPDATPGATTVAAGALIAPLYPQFTGKLPKYAQAWPAADQLLYFYRPLGAVDAAASGALDERTREGYSPVANIKRNRGGALAKRGDACPPGEIPARMELAREMVVSTAAGIASGSVAVSPLVLNDRLACLSCSFKPLCRFERPLNQPRSADRLPRLAPADQPADEADE